MAQVLRSLLQHPKWAPRSDHEFHTNNEAPQLQRGFAVRYLCSVRSIQWRKTTLSGLAALLGATTLLGQSGVIRTQTLLPEQAQEDLEVLRSLVLEVHPDPYRYAPETELMAEFDRVKDSLARPITVLRFHELIMPLFRAVGDANFHPLAPTIGPEAMRLPVKFALLDKGLFVEHELKGFRSLPKGGQVLSINGLPPDSAVARMRKFIVPEGANITRQYGVIAAEFPELFDLYVDREKTFQVVCKAPDGTVHEVLVNGMTADDVIRSKRPQGIALMPWTSSLHTDIGTMWLKLHTLDADTLELAGLNTERFLKGVLQEAKRNSIRTLVIDLRGASGRDLGMAEELFGLIAQEPYRVVQEMSVRCSAPPTNYGMATPIPEFFENVQQQFVPDGDGGMRLRRDDHRLAPVQPLSRSFNGNVYVVCDGLTRDAAAAFVMLAKRSRRARVVGEEVGTNASSFTGGRELRLTLPNSTLLVHVPLTRYVPEGTPSGPLDRGEAPHHWVQPDPSVIARGGDTIKERLLELIRELR
jgi:hypothetical protein